MRLRWVMVLVGALVVWSAGGAAAAGTRDVVVVTPFPKERFEEYKKAFDKKRPGATLVVKQQQTNQGVTYLYEIALDGGPTLHALAANPRGRSLFARGDAVLVTWDAADLLILPGP